MEARCRTARAAIAARLRLMPSWLSLQWRWCPHFVHDLPYIVQLKIGIFQHQMCGITRLICPVRKNLLDSALLTVG